MINETSEAHLKWLCTKGIDFDKSAIDFDKWITEQQDFGILADDLKEQKLDYIKDNLIVTTKVSMINDVMSDFTLVMENCTMLGMEGPTGEMVAEARKSFRSGLQA